MVSSQWKINSSEWSVEISHQAQSHDASNFLCNPVNNFPVASTNSNAKWSDDAKSSITANCIWVSSSANEPQACLQNSRILWGHFCQHLRLYCWVLKQQPFAFAETNHIVPLLEREMSFRKRISLTAWLASRLQGFHVVLPLSTLHWQILKQTTNKPADGRLCSPR